MIAGWLMAMMQRGRISNARATLGAEIVTLTDGIATTERKLKASASGKKAEELTMVLKRLTLNRVAALERYEILARSERKVWAT